MFPFIDQDGWKKKERKGGEKKKEKKKKKARLKVEEVLKEVDIERLNGWFTTKVYLTRCFIQFAKYALNMYMWRKREGRREGKGGERGEGKSEVQ